MPQFSSLPPLYGPINPFDPLQRAATRALFRAIEQLEAQEPQQKPARTGYSHGNADRLTLVVSETCTIRKFGKQPQTVTGTVLKVSHLENRTRVALRQPDGTKKVLIIGDMAQVTRTQGDRQPDNPPENTRSDADRSADAVRHLRKLFRLNLSSVEVLLKAAQTYPTGQSFDMQELARDTGTKLGTVLSWNRTLSHSCSSRGWSKNDFLTPLGRPEPGQPKRFSIPPAVHAAILKIAAGTKDEESDAA